VVIENPHHLEIWGSSSGQYLDDGKIPVDEEATKAVAQGEDLQITPPHLGTAPTA
jgi:hypothetical protein